MYLVLRRDKERFARPSSAMSNAYTAGELYEAYELLQFVLANDDSSSDDSSDDNDDLNDMLLMLVCDPLQRRRLQDIGPEVYSLARLQREAAERGFTADDASSKVQTDFGFRLEWLPEVVKALDPPDMFETAGGHKFTGEEGVLLRCRHVRERRVGRRVLPLLEHPWGGAEPAPRGPRRGAPLPSSSGPEEGRARKCLGSV